MDHDKIIKKIKEGNLNYFESFYRKFFPTLTHFANGYVNDTGIAEDLVQDVFIKFWKNREVCDTIISLKSYLYAMVKNQCISHLKKNRENPIENTPEDIELTFNNKIIEEETYLILKNAIDNLPPQSSKIMNMAIRGIKNQEISEQLDISVNTVKRLKYRAISSLKVSLKDYYFLILLFLLD